MTKKQCKILARILFAAALMLAFDFIPVTGVWRFGIYLIPYMIIGYDILIKAAKGIWNKQVFDENFLMAIATVGALAIGAAKTGEYVEAIAVMLFYQIGELFQSYAVGKSRRNISSLMDIRPDYANVEMDGEVIKVDPDEVLIGTVIIAQPGEKIPIDGVVESGQSSLNTSALTGESLPRDVGAGDEVVSGCINITGVLKIRTTKEFGESTASKILDLVENASSRKSRSEAFISKFARIYTPAVCCGALALAVIPPVVRILFFGFSGEFGEWIYRALTFLVISCPCALVISIPLSFFAGIGGASKEGILVKGSNFIEALAKTDTVVLDKTGTVTKGVFEVNGIYAKGMSSEALLEYAALAEYASSHPISKSLKKAWGKELDQSRVGNIREFGGNGVVTTVDGVEVAAGNIKLMERLCVRCENVPETGTVVYVSVAGEYAGRIVISDIIKPEAEGAIALLKKAGIKKIVMLTGDAKAVAEKVAASVGVDKVLGELLPDGKVDEVEKILAGERKGKTLAFVGDGINDAPVLSRADIGIAMGAIGSDAAIEAADVVLMDDNPMKIAKAIKISRKCMAIVYQNMIFAIGIKVLCLILGAAGVANMWLAIFADVGIMVLAVLNAIRALFVKKL